MNIQIRKIVNCNVNQLKKVSMKNACVTSPIHGLYINQGLQINSTNRGSYVSAWFSSLRVLGAIQGCDCGSPMILWKSNN